MRHIQQRVFAEYNIQLEPEILPLGDWNWDEIRDIWWNFERNGQKS